MATINKDFKIKQGLIVEGSSATVGGNQVLTEVASDQYILDLIGGETLVKSVSNEFDVSAGGELSLDRAVVDAYYDAAGDAAAAQSAAQTFATNADTALYGTVTTDIATAKTAAGVIAQGYADTAEADAIAAAALDATTKADDAEAAAILAAALDATEKADDAEAAAKSYADGLAVNYDAFGAAAAAQTAAEGFATQAVANLVNGAPAVLDTLAELATALENNPDIIADLQDVAAGKQDTLTAGSNIDITGATISVTGLDSSDISDFNAAALQATAFAYDVYGSAQIAEDNAKAHADGLATNYDPSGAAFQALTDANANTTAVVNALTTDDIEEGETNLYFEDSRAKSSAADLLTGAILSNITITGTGAGLVITAENGVAGSDTDDLAEGENNLYFSDERAFDAIQETVPNFTAVEINSVAKEVAATATIATPATATALSWAKADYKTAKALVKFATASHTEVSEVLLTLDSSDNIAITEYAEIGTNGALGTVTATVVGGDVRINVTTLNNATTVIVKATLLA